MTHLKSLNLVETTRQNKYFYDRKMKRIQLCHPLLYYILELYDSGTDPGEWLDNLEQDPVDLENLGRFSKNDIRYYYQKFLLLKKNGYFSGIDQQKMLGAVLTAQTVKESLANVKQVTFETTDRCDLSCAYCGYGKFYYDYDQRQNKNLDPQSAKRFLDYLLEHWNSPLNRSHDRNVFISFYGGEPLLNFPFIREIVDYVKQLKVKHNRFTFSMTTNAINLEKHMDFLYQNDVRLLISLDGNEQNNAYRVFKNGKPAYKTIIENISALRQKYPGYFRDCVNFNAVLHNKNSVADIHRFFKEQFDKSPSIGALNSSGIKESQREEFWKTYSNVKKSLFHSKNYKTIEKDMFVLLPNIQETLLFLHKYNDFCFDDYNDLMYSREEQQKYPTGTCLPFAKKVFLTVNGKILPCERIGQQFGLGAAAPGGVELDFAKIAEKYNNYYDKLKSQCHVCHQAETCKQCIFNIDTIDDKNPVCSGFMNQAAYTKNLSPYLCQCERSPGNYSKILKEVVVE